LTAQEREQLDSLLVPTTEATDSHAGGVPEYDNPIDFIQHEMYIPETPGIPMVLHDEIQRVLREMFAFDGDMLRYTTMVYSSIKKSGKTTICAGIALWQAYRIPNGEIYIVGNDLKQADSRMNQAIRYCLAYNPRMADVKVNRNTSYLPNGTRIEAVPVDARGEAGSNPTGIFWTEVWGAKDRKHEEMWSEMALSPTRQGQAFKLCESYAGHVGESLILERLYQAIVKPENVINHNISPELYADNRTIVYWNTRRYLPWQQGEAAQAYYRQEALEKTPSEFDRQHGNKWVTSQSVFVPGEWWDACKDEIPALTQYQSCVIALDAAVSGDCFAIILVSRDKAGVCAVRRSRIWYPPKNGKIRYRNPQDKNDLETPEGVIRAWCKEFRVVEVAYDETQLHDLCSQLWAEGVAFFNVFSQATDRVIADKQLYDLIRDGRIIHNGDATLSEHIKNANQETDKNASRLRIVKRSESLKIDGAVALSMACSRALYLNISG
jgi:phage terminase large subunit-like protein